MVNNVFDKIIEMENKMKWDDNFVTRPSRNGKWELIEIVNGTYTFRELADSPYLFTYFGYNEQNEDIRKEWC